MKNPPPDKATEDEEGGKIMDKRWLPLILLFAGLIIFTIIQFAKIIPPKEPKAVPMIEKNKQEMKMQIFDEQIKGTYGRVRITK